LISYSATAKGELTLRLQAVAPEAVIQKVIERQAAKAEKQKLTLRAEVTPGLFPVTADEEKLHWVLLQLVDNALKFTPAGGAVTVSAAPQDARVRFSVTDTGIGIPAHRLEEIFEPFQQLDGTASRRYGGTGLGLTLVRRIVETHGGRVIVESQAGRGSTFAFTLTRAIQSSI
jgi:two-component system phosphate regulon sensor histidine kinase PhoR